MKILLVAKMVMKMVVTVKMVRMMIVRKRGKEKEKMKVTLGIPSHVLPAVMEIQEIVQAQ